jgi:cell fate (sporulation/competence/biofilm development) regulator YlbF (YheA/YmcA/DUF963 family)
MPNVTVLRRITAAILLMAAILAPSLPACAALHTAHEKQVMRYLLDDVRNTDKWPDFTGWFLFGTTAAQLKAEYGSAFNVTKTGGYLSFQRPNAKSDYVLTFKNGLVNTVTVVWESLDIGKVISTNKTTESDRAKAMADAFSQINEQVAQDEKKGEHIDNIGYLWAEYRSRARLYRALGKEAQAQRDIASAEAIELQILKNPKKGQENNGPML